MGKILHFEARCCFIISKEERDGFYKEIYNIIKNTYYFSVLFFIENHNMIVKITKRVKISSDFSVFNFQFFSWLSFPHVSSNKINFSDFFLEIYKKKKYKNISTEINSLLFWVDSQTCSHHINLVVVLLDFLVCCSYLAGRCC